MDPIEDLLNLILIVCLLFEAKNCLDTLENVPERRHWVKPELQTRDYLGLFATSFDYIFENDPEQFKANVRMSPPVFDILANLMKRALTKNSIRTPIPPKFRLFLTLTYLANGESTSYLADIFKLGLSTVRQIIQDTCEQLWYTLVPKYMAWPNQTEWQEIADGYASNCNLQHCVGAIDGKNIQICCAPRKRKSKTGIVLLGICDANHSFTAAETMDTSSLWETELGKRLYDNNMNLPEDDYFENTEISFPYYFVADTVFPLRNNLMKSYPGKALTPDRLTFNAHIARAQKTIENTFGVLATRWTILHQGAIKLSTRNAEKVIKSTVALHNFVKAHDPSYCPEGYTDTYDIVTGTLKPGLWRQESRLLKSVKRLTTNNATKKSFALRDILKDYIVTQNTSSI